jgi:HK97 family phage prohead protease
MDHIRCDFEVKFAGTDNGSFEGYGAMFGNVDAYGDVIEKGAFKDTIRSWEDRGKYPPMLLQHGGFLGGAEDLLPVGKYMSMEENSRGLKVSGQLFALNTEKGQYIYEGLKSGALDGMSIGYVAKKFTLGTKAGEPRRTLHSVDLKELSIVTFPANDKARIGNVKSEFDPRELEVGLREAGLSRSDAVKAVAIFKSVCRDGGPPDDLPRDEDVTGLLASVRRNIETLTLKG